MCILCKQHKYIYKHMYVCAQSLMSVTKKMESNENAAAPFVYYHNGEIVALGAGRCNRHYKFNNIECADKCYVLDCCHVSVSVSVYLFIISSAD